MVGHVDTRPAAAMPPPAVMASATSAALSSSMSATTTDGARRGQALGVGPADAPPAPVTMATLPVKS